MADKYKIGDILTAKEDYEVTTGFRATKRTIRKGSQIMIGADKFAYHMNSDMIQPLGEDMEIEGYNADGLAEFIYRFVCSNYPLGELFREYGEEFEVDSEGVKTAIADALTTIGMC